MELDEIVFSSLTAGESLTMEFTMKAGQTVIDTWTATYFADANGRICLSALGRMWNRYFIAYRRRVGGEGNTPQTAPDLLTVVLTYTMEDETTATCQRHLLYSRRHATPTLSSLINHLPFVSKVKYTAPTAKEYVCALSSVSGLTVKAEAIYVLSGVQGTQTIAASNFSWTSSTGGGSIDVSPGVITSHLSSGAVLKEYTIQTIYNNAVVDSCRYIVEQANGLRELCWLNRWGAYETLVLKGSDTLNSNRSASYGWTGDDWSALDMDVTDEYDGSTGYVGEKEWNQVRDLAESPIVWLWNGAWQRVTITGVKLSRVRPTNEARTCVINYRLSDREALII